MKYRVAAWALLGLLVAGGWGLYFSLASKEIPLDPIVSFLSRLTCPIAILGSRFPISLSWALAANFATYALVGVALETLRSQLHRPR